MTGSSHQRRIRRRLQERLSKRAMSEGRYPWLESALAQPEPSGEPEDAIKPTPEDLSREIPPKGVISSTPKPIAPPEPRGEAEGVLEALKQMNEYANEELKAGRLRSMIEGGYIPTADKRGKEFDVGWPKKRRTLWNWLRKLVGQ